MIRIDNQYKVPPGVEAYQREKQDGARDDGVYGTPQIQALAQQLRRRQDPRHLARVRHRRVGRRQRYPVHLPDRRQLLVAGGRRGAIRQGAARRQPQGQEDRLHLSTTIPPAGSRCRCCRISRRARASSSDLRRAAAGARVGSQTLDIAQRFRPDFVIAHVFGRSPSVAIKALKAQRLSATQGDRPRLGRRPRRTSRRLAAAASPKATTRSSSPASATTIR